jgi:Xaa-Pro aminopeptidase
VNEWALLEDVHILRTGWEFPPDEYRHRVERARRLMAGEGIDCLLLTSEKNIRYLTGYYAQEWINQTYSRYVLLPLDREPIAVVPTGRVPGFQVTTWICDIRSWLAPNPTDDGVTLITDALRSVLKPHGRVGAEIGPEMRLGVPVADFLRVRDALDVSFVDAGPILKRLRMVKSSLEVERINRAAQIASDAFERFSKVLVPGKTERDIYNLMHRLLVDLGAEKAPYIVPVSGPYGYDQINVGPTDRVLENGDLLLVDVGATWRGYFCDFDRNFALGRTTDELRNAHSLLFEATQVGIECIRPGRTMSDIWRAMTTVIAPDGRLNARHGRMGHGVGLDLAEPPSLAAADDTVVEEGMVLTLEPMVTLPGAGGMPWRRMVHEEDGVVTKTGFDLLTRRVDSTLPIV